MIKLVIFDFDGVLADSNEAWVDIFNKASNATGINQSFTYDDIRSDYGKPYIEVIRNAHPKFKEGGEILESMYTNFLTLATADDFIESFKSIKGTKKILSELKKKYKLAVASGNSKRLLVKYLNNLKLYNYFDFIASGDEVKHGKPYPDILIKILDHFKIDAKNSVYIGDSESDILAAKSAKMTSITVLTGALNKDSALQLKPDHIIKDVTCIFEVLK